MKSIFITNQKQKLIISKSKSKINKNIEAELHTQLLPFTISHFRTTPNNFINDSLLEKENQYKKSSQNEGNFNCQVINSQGFKNVQNRAKSNSSQILQEKQVRSYSVSKLVRNKKREMDVRTTLDVKEEDLPNSVLQLTEELIMRLKNQFVLSQNHITNYTIRKQNFSNLFTYFLSFISTKDLARRLQLSQKYPTISFLQPMLQKIVAFTQQSHRKEYIHSAKFKLRIISQEYSSNQFQKDVNKQRNMLQNILNQKWSMTKKNQELQKINDNLKTQITQNQVSVQQQIQLKHTISEQIQKLQAQKQSLKYQIFEHNQIFEKTKQTQDKITNYVNDQTNKIVQIMSDQYKKIQSDIYEYAVYLQSNQLASDIDYEPQPFKVIEDDIVEQLKLVNSAILQDQKMEISIKNKMMRDFVMLAMDKFKKKDMELQKLNEFKTKCIKTFVSNMQRWLDNWTLKQEYLVNLRNQFLIDDESIDKRLILLKQKKLCQNCRQFFGFEIEQIRMVYRKIGQNYKMGNSFY